MKAATASQFLKFRSMSKYFHNNAPHTRKIIIFADVLHKVLRHTLNNLSITTRENGGQTINIGTVPPNGRSIPIFDSGLW